MLSSNQRAHLKSVGHSLKPVIHVGKKGVTSALATETEAALLKHELIKVKFLEYEDLEQEAKDLADRAGADVVGVTGSIAMLYAPHPEKPKIRVPKASQ